MAALTHGLLDAGAGDLDEEAIAGKLSDIAAHLGGSLDSDRAGLSLRTLSNKAERDTALDLMRLAEGGQRGDAFCRVGELGERAFTANARVQRWR